ncbi:hypothetical protein E2C01_044615 [Portunus trituberculatus]|uniref:Uncharacterized protein n=1 Tax=Portunus trituberculatus TaxID=210409 RepID=A0A5B7FTK4_PORTR|nr:hypothetical protein [Portunus trituberculatus]
MRDRMQTRCKRTEVKERGGSVPRKQSDKEVFVPSTSSPSRRSKLKPLVTIADAHNTATKTFYGLSLALCQTVPLNSNSWPKSASLMRGNFREGKSAAAKCETVPPPPPRRPAPTASCPSKGSQNLILPSRRCQVHVWHHRGHGGHGRSPHNTSAVPGMRQHATSGPPTL